MNDQTLLVVIGKLKLDSRFRIQKYEDIRQVNQYLASHPLVRFQYFQSTHARVDEKSGKIVIGRQVRWYDYKD